ncbi:MAG: hypothetical protein NWE80_05010 [Candidatus Bathyarchaeota archaeon]|nr:hypothetical protein [Candidatus Bathyarchaeota archaeon]
MYKKQSSVSVFCEVRGEVVPQSLIKLGQSRGERKPVSDWGTNNDLFYLNETKGLLNKIKKQSDVPVFWREKRRESGVSVLL